jgi:tRNA-splicing ligase RtcB (3'-phosphate/5'-hydroxy nucleic acid ligase)
MHEIIETSGSPIKAWVSGVPFEKEARAQLTRVAELPFVFRHVAVMPDVHVGIGATVGSVIATTKAIVPAAVGVDIGCGMIAARTSLTASDLPDDLHPLRNAIERAVPHGGPGLHGSWRDKAPEHVIDAWSELQPAYAKIFAKHPKVEHDYDFEHLGTLGTGNHFVELCLGEDDSVWIMLHSGSRGVGNRIGSYFIERAREEMMRLDRKLPHRDLAYFEEGTTGFSDYVEAVSWAQSYAAKNRELMMSAVVTALARSGKLRAFTVNERAVNCHHNYVSRETHFDTDVWVTRKGAVSAKVGELGIIPGSMGARSFIVRGKGNADSFSSCSHGAGRVMSRTEAKRRFTVEDHIKATSAVECRKDAGVIDETPMAYKSIDKVMAAQDDLVEIVHTLRQVVCVKG